MKYPLHWIWKNLHSRGEISVGDFFLIIKQIHENNSRWYNNELANHDAFFITTPIINFDR